MPQIGNGFLSSTRAKIIILSIVLLVFSVGVFKVATYSPKATQNSEEVKELPGKRTHKTANGKIAVAGVTVTNSTVPESSTTAAKSSKKSSKKSSTTTKPKTSTTGSTTVTTGVTGPTSKKIDMVQYFPGTGFTDRYLDGFNSKPTKSWSVLWFEVTAFNADGMQFKTYNSDPSADSRKCHSDSMFFTAPNRAGNVSPEGDLLYLDTTDECNFPAQPKTSIVYSPGIVQIPRTWDDGSTWKVNGSTTATYKENGVLKCTGINRYTNEITGYQTLNGHRVIHWSTNQTVTWTGGPGSSYTGCAPGEVTKWEEHHYYGDTLRMPDGSLGKGLVRTVGGNKEINYPNWDVTFDRWTKLPDL